MGTVGEITMSALVLIRLLKGPVWSMYKCNMVFITMFQNELCESAEGAGRLRSVASPLDGSKSSL